MVDQALVDGAIEEDLRIEAESRTLILGAGATGRGGCGYEDFRISRGLVGGDGGNTLEIGLNTSACSRAARSAGILRTIEILETSRGQSQGDELVEAKERGACCGIPYGGRKGLLQEYVGGGMLAQARSKGHHCL